MSEKKAEFLMDLARSIENSGYETVEDVIRVLMLEATDEHDRSHRSSGWSTTVGTLKKILRYVPDDYEVMLENADVDDTEIATLSVQRMYPPTEDSPGLLVLSSGQTVSSEYGYHERMDADHEVGTSLHWVERKNRWQS